MTIIFPLSAERKSLSAAFAEPAIKEKSSDAGAERSIVIFSTAVVVVSLCLRSAAMAYSDSGRFSVTAILPYVDVSRFVPLRSPVKERVPPATAVRSVTVQLVQSALPLSVSISAAAAKRFFAVILPYCV